jgi:peptidyl-prolyl cis-trans isomerase SurA
MMSFGPFRKAALVAALSALSVTAVAQPAPQPPQTGRLDLPQQVTFVGAQEPNTARPTAIVNDEIITRTDIDQRMALIVASTRVQIPAEEMDRLRAQVLRNLIDEALQIQAARENEVTVEPREVDRYYVRFAQQFGHTPQSFGDYLRSIGSSERSVKRQIQGEISWQRVQQRRLVRVSVADGEVQEILNRMNAARGSREYHVLEIYLSATPETANEVRNNAARIIQQIRGGGSFPAYARQFSEASTAAVGGDLGWLRAE